MDTLFVKSKERRWSLGAINLKGGAQIHPCVVHKRGLSQYDVLKSKQSTGSFKIFEDDEEDQHVPMALEATEPEKDLMVHHKFDLQHETLFLTVKVGVFVAQAYGNGGPLA
ncbi:hypothetical protein Hanom_Chr04g00331271 [Helianthus anomalus]